MYINLASWGNQPSFFKKMNFKTFCKLRGMSNENYKIYKNNIDVYLKDIGKKGSCWKYMDDFEKENPDISEKYFNIIPDSLLKYGNGNKVNIK